jgi:hypothetical protein
MSQVITITIAAAGTDTGPFNIYTNLDYVTPINTGVLKADLLAGFVTSAVPNGATSVRVKSNNANCVNYVDMTITGLTSYYYNVQQRSFSCAGGTGTCTGNIGGNLIGYSTVELVVGGFYNSSGDVYEITGTTTPQSYNINITTWAGSNYTNCSDATQC